MIETSITKDNGKNIWRRFIKSVASYKLILPGDHIAVCISGGKDSMLLAKLLQMAKTYGLYDIELEYIMLDAGFSKDNLQIVKDNADRLGIPLKIFNVSIFDDVDQIEKGSPCFFAQE